MREVLSGYQREVDCYKENQWHKAMRLFNDTNICRTWACETVGHSEKNMSHSILKKDGQVFAMAQARRQRIPLLKTGIAYVRWEPIGVIRPEPESIDLSAGDTRSEN